DVMEVQQRIAEGARAALEPQAKGGHGTMQQPSDVEAFTLYLRGRFWWNKRTADGLTRASAAFQQALDRDPSYAPAWVGLADWYALHLAYRGLFERGLEEANEAQRLDPLSIVASNSVSVVNGYWGHWDDVIAQSDRLIAMDATSPVAHIWKGRALRARGDLKG